MTDKEQSETSNFDKEGFVSLFLNPQVPFSYKAMLVGGVLMYTIFPIDFIPELLGPLGFADDAGIAIIAAKVFTHLANQALEKKKMAADAPVVQGTATPTEPANVRAQAAQSTPPPAANPAPPTNTTDALRDEAHEQLIEKKQAASDDDFERMLRERNPNAPTQWDNDRHNPLDKRK